MVDEASVSGKDGETVQDSRWGRCGRPSGVSAVGWCKDWVRPYLL